jgi:hypothetical protein
MTRVCFSIIMQFVIVDIGCIDLSSSITFNVLL